MSGGDTSPGDVLAMLLCALVFGRGGLYSTFDIKSVQFGLSEREREESGGYPSISKL